MKDYLKELNLYCHYSKYTKWHNKIILNAIGRKWQKRPNDGLEKHHILPKSFGGDNTKLNYVTLTPREHFVVHTLLLKMLKDVTFYNKMLFALFNMKASNKLYNRNNTSRVYEKYKAQWQLLQSQRQKKYMSDVEFKQRVIAARKETYKNNPEICKKISESLKGRKRLNMNKDVITLKGESRTEAQKLASKVHSERMKGKIPHNKGMARPGRPVKTPDGIFQKGKEVCKFYNITSGTVVYRCKNKLYGFSYLDD